MRLAERFQERIGQVYEANPVAADLMPMVLSRACVDVLDVAGAGVTMTGSMLRVPLGSSDDAAARAERLQTTLGEGPCLTAAAGEEPLAADLSTIAHRWPTFHLEFTAQTPFRSVISIPLHASHGTCFGALDLYATATDLSPELSIPDITNDIAAPIAAVLFDRPPRTLDGGIALAPWLRNSTVSSRMHVWVAVGMLVDHAGLTNVDALAALRAHAFRLDMTLDEVADQLTSEDVEPATVLT
ncbi:MAG TPA: ANTAR domain-containing protein [Propionibacteriaceae bacterium]